MKIIGAPELSDLLSKNESSRIVVLVHSPNCGHCQSMMPEWEKMENHIKVNTALNGVDDQCYLSKIDGADASGINNEHLRSISGVPSIIYLKNGKQEDSFDRMNKARTMPNLLDFVKSKLSADNSNKIKLFKPSVSIQKKRRVTKRKTKKVQKKKSKARGKKQSGGWRSKSKSKGKSKSKRKNTRRM